MEWVVADVERLSRFIESDTDLNGDDEPSSIKNDDQSFEILSQSPLLGDGKFKLEIGTLTACYYERLSGCNVSFELVHQGLGHSPSTSRHWLLAIPTAIMRYPPQFSLRSKPTIAELGNEARARNGSGKSGRTIGHSDKKAKFGVRLD